MIKTNYSLLILTLAIAMICSCSNPKKPVGTASSFETIDALLNQAVKDMEIPGAVAYISQNGKEIHNKAYGYQSMENATAMTPNSIFRLASMTKALTAVSILQLYEQEKLGLDDAVKLYLPEFTNMSILNDVLPDSTFTSSPAKNDITIRQLLTHTSGIGYGFTDDKCNALVIKNDVSEGFCPDDRTSFENTKKIAALPLLAEPGAENIYGMSYDVLGTLIEKISGERYDNYVSQHILKPLRMNDSYFLVPKEERYRLPHVYEPNADENGLERATYRDVDYPILEFRRFYSGGADMSCTAADYNKFLLMIANNGSYNNHKVLEESSIKLMLSEQTPFNDDDSSQGFAAWIVNDKGAKNGLRPKGSYDFGGFFDTYCWVDPEQNFTAILMLQMYPTNAHDVHWKFQKAVYDLMKTKA